MMVYSLTGDINEELDLKMKVFRKINEHLSKAEAGEARIKELFEQNDTIHDGTLDPHDLKKVLRTISIDLPDNELDRFIWFLDKDAKNRIDYYWFFN